MDFVAQVETLLQRPQGHEDERAVGVLVPGTEYPAHPEGKGADAAFPAGAEHEDFVVDRDVEVAGKRGADKCIVGPRQIFALRQCLR